MLARYPKLEAVSLRSSSSSPCPILPRLYINYEQEDESDWTAQRGCDSAPVVLDHRGSGRFFGLGQVQEGEDEVEKIDHQEFLQLPPPPVDSEDEDGDDEAAADATATACSATMDVTPEEDFKRIFRCVQLLHNSGYYYEGLSWQQASLKLRKCRVGTFLVRESENANFLFTLSVQTKKGPTSIRIAYKGGLFRMDSDDDLISRMPVFETVTDLVEYYVKISKELLSQKDVSCCWLDLAGECSAPVELYQPLYKNVHTLQHLCRLNIVKNIKKTPSYQPFEWTVDHTHSLGLPVALKAYLKEYPHGH